MKQILIEIFGEGKDLSALQMCSRGILIFIVALILIRLSGRRSFGLRAPFDNIIMILLGAVLSRAVVGASPLLSTIATCAVIVLIHRLLGFFVVRSPFLSKLVEGEKIVLFEDQKFIKKNMNRGLVCKEDILQGVRKTALTESMDKIESVFIEKNGEITAIKKTE